MAATTAGRTDIEKVVRKVLKQERDENERTTLRAIQRVSSLLTEQVIPNLPDNAEADDETGGNDEQDGQGGEHPSGARSAMFASRSAHAADDVADDSADDGNVSDGDQAAEVPAEVMDAFASLYRTLSAEQAEALGAFFTAVSEALGQVDEGQEDEDTGADAEENPRLH
jgi:hypothetical protein